MTSSGGSLLSVEDLSKSFGGFLAVRKVSFHVEHGEIVGLVGPNGAGKTTIFNLLTGFLRASQGSVVFKGTDITNFRPPDIARMGVVRTFQLNKVFPSLTVERNIEIGCHKREKGGLMSFLFNPSKQDRDAAREMVEKISEMVGLQDLRKKTADSLSYGDQKLLGIGIALGVAPTLLMLDEPFAGMNPKEVMQCVSSLRRIFEDGTTIFLIDHNMRAVMGFCDRILVVNFGEKVAEGKPDDVCADAAVISCYLGGSQC
jgi:branched-chain amino acid transport system ATP-binding protein